MDAHLLTCDPPAPSTRYLRFKRKSSGGYRLRDSGSATGSAGEAAHPVNQARESSTTQDRLVARFMMSGLFADRPDSFAMDLVASRDRFASRNLRESHTPGKINSSGLPQQGCCHHLQVCLLDNN